MMRTHCRCLQGPALVLPLTVYICLPVAVRACLKVIEGYCAYLPTILPLNRGTESRVRDSLLGVPLIYLRARTSTVLGVLLGKDL